MHRLIELQKITDPRGNLTFLQYPNQIPFEIKRVFWTYDVPSGEKRGGHAYGIQHEIIIALSGSFEVVITDREGNSITITLSKPNDGLYLPPNTWRQLQKFSTNAFSLHLSSEVYNELDYIRDFNQYSMCK
jgi:hypothetical protein